ncbi:MAG: hypothetical protein RRX93_06620 [Bacteroidales bacterium]
MIWVDDRVPLEVKQNLQKLDEVYSFSSNGITYDAIAGHPDVFMCVLGERKLVLAPNIPLEVKKIMEKEAQKRGQLFFEYGYLPVGKFYPETALYNACSLASSSMQAERVVVGNWKCLDRKIVERIESERMRGGRLSLVQVSQGYTRCNLIELSSENSEETVFITSDRGIEKTLNSLSFTVVYVDPTAVVLPGFSHGFIGGCCGVVNNKLCFTGKLSNLLVEDSYKIRKMADYCRLEIIELSQGPLIDGGGILQI